MLEFIALIVGIAIGLAVQRYRSRRSVLPPQEPPKAAPAPDAVAPNDLPARLAPLREALDKVVKSRAHQREIADRAELKQAAGLLADSQVAPTTEDGFEKALAAVPASAFVVRRYRFEPSPLVRDARRGWRSGRVREVMAGNFDLLAGSAAESA